MLALAAAPLGIELRCLDPADRPPASHVTAVTRGALTDLDAVVRFAQAVDVLTVEIEAVSVPALRRVAEAGTVVAPDPDLLATIQDKLAQKRFLAHVGLPVAREIVPDEALDRGRTRVPLVQKARRGGYDGRGVAILAAGHAPPLAEDAFFEERIDVAREIAVTVARSRSGAVASYAPVGMTFVDHLNLVDEVIVPAGLSSRLERHAISIAEAAVRHLNIVGVATVELFVTAVGSVVINEIAPRPHNAAHLTMDAADTSQFEQHLRAILDMPLGSTRFHSAAAMRNIVAAAGAAESGHSHDSTPPPSQSAPPAVLWRGVAEAMAIPGVHVHRYGKDRAPAGRKMGHVTVTSDDLRAAREHAARAQSMIRVAEGVSP